MKPGVTEKTPIRAGARSVYRSLEWRISPRATLISAQRYSKFVRFMKSALPLTALALAIAVIAYALQPRDLGRMAMTFEQVERIEGDLSMIKPRLTGTDDNGMPFVVTAASATQEGRGSNRVHLQDVSADINFKDGTILHVKAASGVVDTGTHVLEVSGGMRLVSDDGYDARTDSAIADLKAGTIHGENGIEAQGNFGRVTAERFALDRDTRQLRFLGKVSMTINGNGSLTK